MMQARNNSSQMLTISQLQYFPGTSECNFKRTKDDEIGEFMKHLKQQQV